MLAGASATVSAAVTELHRSRVWRQFDSVLSRSLGVVVAPAGFGKSLAIAQWIRQIRVQARWQVAVLALNNGHNSVHRLREAITAVLREASVQVLWDNDFPTLISESSDNIIVFDNVDRIHNEEANALLGNFCDQAAPVSRIVLSGRRRPRILLADQEVGGRVVLLDARAFAFDIDETVAMVGCTRDQGSRIVRKTGGWPLAISWLARHPAYLVDQDLRGISESIRSGSLGRLLEEVVFSAFSTREISLLRDLSTLQEVTPSLVEHVLQRKGLLFYRMAGLEGILDRVHDYAESFAWNPICREWLEFQLQVRSPTRARTLHRRALQAIDQADIAATTWHMLRLGDEAGAIRRIATEGGWQLTLRHGPQFVNELLSLFPQSTVAREPVLLIIQAYQCLHRGDAESAAVLLAHTRRACSDQKMLPRELPLIHALCSHYRDLPMESGERAGLRAFAQSRDIDPLNRGTAFADLAAHDIDAAQLRDAERAALRCIELMQDARCENGVAYGLLHLGQSYFYQGNWKGASEAFSRASLLARGQVQADIAIVALADAMSAQLAYEHDRLEQAQQLVAFSLPVIIEQDGWYSIFAMVFQTAVGVYLAQSDFALASRTVQQAHDLAEKRNLKRLDTLALVLEWEIELHRDFDGPSCQRLASAVLGADLSDWRARNLVYYGIARSMLLRGRFADAFATAQEASAFAKEHGRLGHEAAFSAISAIAHHGRGEHDESVAALGSATAFAQSAGAIRLLVDAGPGIRPTVQAALARRSFDSHISSYLEVLDVANRAYGPASKGIRSREMQVLDGLRAGESNKELARRLGLSENTIKFHLKAIYRKLNVGSRIEAVVAAQRIAADPAVGKQ